MNDWAGFKYSTKRNPARRSIGPRQAKIAAALGKPGMPWQREVWDVAGELDDDGNLVYEIVIVTVPRQSGKTTLYGPVQLDTCIVNPGVKTFYTAQTGKDARSRFGDLVALVQDSPLHAITRYRASQGDEGMHFPNGSALKIFAPVVAALHGETPPLVGLDEIWELDEALGDALLEGAIIPAQVTLAGRRQVWMLSTAGTALSTFMRKWIERGREAVESGGEKWPKIAYFEASLFDGDDPYDPAAIARFHPAVGHTVTVEELLEVALGVTRATWLRAFCNVWTEAVNPLFAAEDWDALAVAPTGIPRRRDLTVTYEVGADNECGAVLASWRDDDGAPCVRVLHAAPGTNWMHDLIVQIRDEWKPAVLGADDGGPTRRLTDQLRRTLGDDAVVTTGVKDYATACESLLTMARDRELKHDGSKTLSNAIAHLVLKRVGDTTKFSRNDSTGPIPGIIAAAVGIWLHDHRTVDVGKPVIYT